MVATAAPSLAASLPLVGTDVATWDAFISPHNSPASRTLIIGTQVNVSYLKYPTPTNVTLSVNVLLEVFLDEEWDTIFGPTTTDATLHWRLTVNGVLLTPQGETGFYVPQRQEPSDANPQTGIVTMNNPDNALIDD